MSIREDTKKMYISWGHSALAWDLTICESGDPFICFYTEKQDTIFAFPRCLKDGQTEWYFQEFRFETSSTVSPAAEFGEPLYHVRAFRGEELKAVFLFGYRTGLIFMADVDQARVERPEQIVFTTALVVDGLAFGANLPRKCE